MKIKRIKWIRRITSLFVAVALVLGTTPLEGIKVNAASQSYTSGDYTYTLSENDYGDNVATITGYNGTEASVIVPNTIDGYSIIGIENNAFLGKNTLVSVEMPDSIVRIGDCAFSECKKLTNVNLPKSLVRLERMAFYNCKGITSIEIPKTLETGGSTLWGKGPFTGCDNLKNVTFEEGTTCVAENLFYNCSSIERISIPETVTEIKDSAFDRCENLTTVEMSDAITRIGDCAFSECKKLTNVNLPKSLVRLERMAFYNCKGITSIEIPKTLETGGSTLWGKGPFTGCDNLKKITFMKGTTRVADALFYNCPGVEQIEIPDTVTDIESNAFDSCSNLFNVKLPKKLSTIGDNAFRNCNNLCCVEMINETSRIGSNAFTGCNNLLMICNYYTYPVIYSIDNKIRFAPSGTKFVDNENKVIDRKKSKFTANMDSVTANGYLPMSINYSVKEKWEGELTNKNIVTYIPEFTELDEASIKVNGEFISDYRYKDNRLIIPVSVDSGSITYDIKIKSKEKVVSYAYFSARKNGSDVIENIDVINEDFSGITLSAPNTISSNKVEISGIAPVSKDVDIYVDGVKQSTVKALKNGSWNGTVEISNPTDYYTYTVEVRSVDEYDADISASQDISYEEKAPQIEELSMKYIEHGKTKVCDLIKTVKPPRIYFLPGGGYEFDTSIKNDESISKVYITSTRNNEKKYMEAKYDEATGKYIAKGFFDPDNTGYVPGKIGVEFIKNNKKVDASDKFDITQIQTMTADDVNKAQVDYELNTKDEVLATIDLSDVVKDMSKASIKAHIKYNDSVKGSSYDDLRDIYGIGKNVYKYLVPDKYGNQYIMTMDYSDPDNIVMLLYDTVDAGTTVATQAIEFNLDMAQFGTDEYMKMFDLKDGIGNFSKAATFAYKSYGIYSDYNDLIKEIDQSSIIDNKFEAKQKALELRQDQMAFLALTTVMPILVAGSTMAAPVLAFSLLLGAMISVSDVFWQYRIGQIKGGTFNMKWVIDPSGYVYEKGTDNRIENATVTAYYIPYDDTDDFWKNKPADDTYGTVWDASEYEQTNPLKTNGDGKYAWDVPEGWWRVKCEAEGYKTLWSDWMTVPPVQTDVNFAMVSVNSPDPTEEPDPTVNPTPTITPADSTEKTADSSKTDVASNPSISNNSTSESFSSVQKPAKVKIKNLKLKKKSVTVKWKKVAGAKGYQIRYSKKKSFKSFADRYTKKTTYTFSKMKKGRTYYFKVRAYTVDSYGNKVYGTWSSVKKKKVK